MMVHRQPTLTHMVCEGSIVASSETTLPGGLVPSEAKLSR